MRKAGRRLLAVLGALLLAAVLPVTALAAPGEDTFLTILVYGAPKDATLTLRYPESAELETMVMEREDRVWETYFRVYFRGHLIKWRRGLPDGTQLVVEAGGEGFVLPLPEDCFTGENAVFQLDLDTCGLREGGPPFRTVLLAALRIAVTLLLQTLIFFLLRYRERRSWKIFAVTAAVTQAALQLLIFHGASTLTSDYVLWVLVALILMEAFVTVVHTIFLSHMLWEYRERQAVTGAVLCNAVTLGIGAVNVLFLPM